jgi:hypothetical protein
LPTGIDDCVQIGKLRTKGLPPLIPTLRLFLGIVHRVADQFAEAHFWMHFADDVTQFGAGLQKNIDLPNLFSKIAKVCLLIALPFGPLASERAHASSKRTLQEQT